MVVLGLDKECLGYEQVFVLFRVWVGRDLLMFQSLREKASLREQASVSLL